MPITVSRPVSVYRLWDDDDLRECFAALAGVGWVCSLVARGEDDGVVWVVGLQNNTSRQQLTATLDDVVVSDLVTVVAQTVTEFNTDNPGNQIVRD